MNNANDGKMTKEGYLFSDGTLLQYNEDSKVITMSDGTHIGETWHPGDEGYQQVLSYFVRPLDEAIEFVHSLGLRGDSK